MNRAMALLAVSLISFCLPQTASALDDLEIGVGLKGGLTGAGAEGINEGEPYTLPDGRSQQEAQGPDFYPMFGLGGGIGGFVELRLMDLFGFETGLFLSYDNGEGWEDKEPVGRVYQRQRTSALHMPLVAKASVPGFVRPTFGLGTEIVFQQKSTLRYSSDVINVSSYEQRYQIDPSTYALLLFTFALEIDLDVVRVPIELRLAYNLGFDNAIDERTEVMGTGGSDVQFVYDGKYQGHFGLFTGIIYDFDIL